MNRTRSSAGRSHQQSDSGNTSGPSKRPNASSTGSAPSSRSAYPYLLVAGLDHDGHGMGCRRAHEKGVELSTWRAEQWARLGRSGSLSSVHELTSYLWSLSLSLFLSEEKKLMGDIKRSAKAGQMVRRCLPSVRQLPPPLISPRAPLERVQDHGQGPRSNKEVHPEVLRHAHPAPGGLASDPDAQVQPGDGRGHEGCLQSDGTDEPVDEPPTSASLFLFISCSPLARLFELELTLGGCLISPKRSRRS